jgi:hypothetical protein
VVGFRDGRALVMPLDRWTGITLGARADFEDRPATIYPSKAWLGRVIDGFGKPVDGKGCALPQGHDRLSHQGGATARHFARPHGRQARSWCARHECIHHLLRRSAHGHFRRQRRGQIYSSGRCWRAIPMPMSS